MALATRTNIWCGSLAIWAPSGPLDTALLGSSNWLATPMNSEWSVTAKKSSGQARLAGIMPLASA